MFPRLLLTLLLLPLLAFSQKAKEAASSYNGVAVIELFTSQGDINSPPADKLLSEIIADAEKNNKPVYCLSMHVDFWNRFGWKDPFSSLRYTNRLTNYTTVLGMKETYTPLMIINGRTALSGADRKKAFEEINSELSKKAPLEPEFTYEIFDDTLDVLYDVKSMPAAGKSGSDTYINIAVVEKGLSTIVSKGDNEGITLKNDNVTRLFHTADLKSQKGVIRIPVKSLKQGPSKTIILFVQQKSTRKVIGATARKFNN
jgi:hypothetical protein